MKTLTEFIRELKETVSTVVLIGERTHWIFNNDDEISQGWAERFEVVEILSENNSSIIARIKYCWND